MSFHKMNGFTPLHVDVYTGDGPGARIAITPTEDSYLIFIHGGIKNVQGRRGWIIVFVPKDHTVIFCGELRTDWTHGVLRKIPDQITAELTGPPYPLTSRDVLQQRFGCMPTDSSAFDHMHQVFTPASGSAWDGYGCGECGFSPYCPVWGSCENISWNTIRVPGAPLKMNGPPIIFQLPPNAEPISEYP
jgi:hypothetical protein